MRYVLATALAASAALDAHPAEARDTRYRVDIGAVDAADALVMLSAQTGISVATDHPIPRRAIGAMRGEMTAGDALDRLLRSLGLGAVQVGPRTYRITQRKRANDGTTAGEPPPLPTEDIIVTGRKQSEMLSGMAAPVAVYVPGNGDRSGAATTTRDVARGIEGLALTNGGAGRERPFIRGVADSPFNGLSQSTVSVQFNDTRLTYNAPEPGLRLVDIDRVEVLKGPQGPLYGTGALGGVYRIVTNRPVLGLTEGEAGFGASSTAGGVGGQAEGMINLPLIGDRVAVRIVGYAASDPGWIDDAKFGRGLNRSVTRGARVALRVAPANGWTVDLNAVEQSISTHDSQYVNRAGGERSRDLPFREPHHAKVQILQSMIAGSIGSLRLTIATGVTRQTQADVYDASASAAALGIGSPALYSDWRRYVVVDQEIRLASPPGSNFSWVTGGSFMLARTDADGPLLSGSGPSKGSCRHIGASWRARSSPTDRFRCFPG